MLKPHRKNLVATCQICMDETFTVSPFYVEAKTRNAVCDNGHSYIEERKYVKTKYNTEP